MQHDVWIVMLCALVVAGRAMQRYDTPETKRLTTTRNLFLFSAACYVMASLAVYALLSEIVFKPGGGPRRAAGSRDHAGWGLRGGFW